MEFDYMPPHDCPHCTRPMEDTGLREEEKGSEIEIYDPQQDAPTVNIGTRPRTWTPPIIPDPTTWRETTGTGDTVWYRTDTTTTTDDGTTAGGGTITGAVFPQGT